MRMDIIGVDQINALQSFTYNLGIGSLNQLTANGTRSDDEIAEAMVKYVNAGGEPQPGLVANLRRREQLAFINPSNQNVQQVVSQPVQQVNVEEVDVTSSPREVGRNTLQDMAAVTAEKQRQAVKY